MVERQIAVLRTRHAIARYRETVLVSGGGQRLREKNSDRSLAATLTCGNRKGKSNSRQNQRGEIETSRSERCSSRRDTVTQCMWTSTLRLRVCSADVCLGPPSFGDLAVRTRAFLVKYEFEFTTGHLSLLIFPIDIGPVPQI